jgi:hypothetical protein
MSINNQSKVEESSKKLLAKRADKFLMTIRKNGWTQLKLYENGKTSELIKERGTLLNTFRRNVSRMRKGIGLFNDPLLLSFILEDTGYPAHALFLDETTTPSNMPPVFGHDAINALESIIYRAVQDAQKPFTRIAKIEKRLTAANNIFGIVSMFMTDNYYSLALFFLFFQFSKINPSVYRHSDDRQLLIINNLVDYLSENNNNFLVDNNFGKLLSLSYLIFEITRISNSFIKYNMKKENNTLSLKSRYEGFIFPKNYSRSELAKVIQSINTCLEKIIINSISIKTITFGSHSQVLSSAHQLLGYLLSVNYNISDFQNKLSKQSMMKSMLFSSKYSSNVLVHKPRFICKIDDTFIYLINNINTLLTNILNENSNNVQKNVKDKKDDGNDIYDENKKASSKSILKYEDMPDDVIGIFDEDEAIISPISHGEKKDVFKKSSPSKRIHPVENATPVSKKHQRPVKSKPKPI